MKVQVQYKKLFYKILGIDEYCWVNWKNKCSFLFFLFFERMSNVVPWFINHSESFYHCLNQSFSNANTKTLTRVAMAAKK